MYWYRWTKENLGDSFQTYEPYGVWELLENGRRKALIWNHVYSGYFMGEVGMRAHVVFPNHLTLEEVKALVLLYL